MKFSWKVFFSVLVIVAVTFSVGGYILISSTFRASYARELKLAQEGNRLLKFSFETAVASLPSDYESLTESTLKNIAQSLDTEGYRENRQFRLSGQDYATLYTNLETQADNGLLREITPKRQGTQVILREGRYLVQTICQPYAAGKTVYLESFRDIKPVFRQRTQDYAVYRLLILLLLVFSGLGTYFLSLWLTRPIQQLSRTTRQIAEGQYEKRAEVKSMDEIGALAQDFNVMADALEKKIEDLEEAARRQEDFVGSFAHELKTPLTSIIGYADILRSRTLEPDRQFRAANYIFSEGMRLEALSLKMMELMILRRQDFTFIETDIPGLFREISGILAPVMEQSQITLSMTSQEAVLLLEPDLIKTLLLNLIDNARKATDAVGKIVVRGEWNNQDYILSVQDFGSGIPQEELSKITEAFYMVDKSRSRAHGGAGLGLAICKEIAQLHKAGLEFDSVPGRGTLVRLRFPEVLS